ncbi:MAG: DUF305 domain-containing protein [Chloroflexi bacterium]|nr:DUF305 domain-containing protein [Chloroflexota bacterium]
MPESYTEEPAFVEDAEELEETPKGVSRGLLGIALLVVVLFATGLAGWWWVSNLKPASDSPEINFARDMSDHHAQAVDMAVKIRDRTTDPDLRIFALDIILTQQNQIGQMQGWLTVWQYPLAGAKSMMSNHGQMMGMATVEQVYALDTLPVAEAEIAFLQLMIRHHQGGVAMARTVLNQTTRPEVTRLANSIVVGQQSEITYMKELLQKRGVTV